MVLPNWNKAYQMFYMIDMKLAKMSWWITYIFSNIVSITSSTNFPPQYEGMHTLVVEFSVKRFKPIGETLSEHMWISLLLYRRWMV